jgi:hypothetical protein
MGSAASASRLTRPGIHAESAFLTVNEMRNCATVRYCIGSRDKGKRRSKDFISWHDPSNMQSNMKTTVHLRQLACLLVTSASRASNCPDFPADDTHPYQAVLHIKPLIPRTQARAEQSVAGWPRTRCRRDTKSLAGEAFIINRCLRC